MILEEEPIGTNVLRALELDSERKLALIQRHIPKMVRGLIQEFAAIKDSSTYTQFRSGRLEYARFVLQKPGPRIGLEEARTTLTGVSQGA